MIEAGSSLYTRHISSFPISIGTGLALESLFQGRLPPYDEKREIPQHINIQKYNEAWFSLFTLYRNLVGSVDKNVFLTEHPNALADVLNQEIDVIYSLFKHEGNDVCKPIFYHCSYKSLNNLDHRIQLRQDTTEFQKVFSLKFLKVFEIIKRRQDIKMFNTNFSDVQRVNALIMTHVCYDLLNYTQFKTLELLESNTGKLKTRLEWNSKYFPLGSQSLSHLPFIKILLLIFGDKVLIRPADIKLRRLILEISETQRWTPVTTREKILYDFESSIKDHYLLNFLKTIY